MCISFKLQDIRGKKNSRPDLYYITNCLLICHYWWHVQARGWRLWLKNRWADSELTMSFTYVVISLRKLRINLFSHQLRIKVSIYWVLSKENCNIKKSLQWVFSVYLAQDTSLFPRLLYIWWPYDTNRLRDSWS